MNNPLVSIMIPAYNAEMTIAKAIKSLLYQTYTNWECVIVNDGSTDNTVEIIKGFKDNRIKLYSFETNKGRGSARKFAMQKCNGELYAMLDADDWYYHDKLEKQVDFFKKNIDVDIVSCGMIIQKDNDCVAVRGIGNNKIYNFDKPRKVPIPHASSMFRANIVGNNVYDINFKLGQDTDFLRRIMLGRKYAQLDFVGYVYDEYISNNYSKILSSYQFSAKSYLKFIKVNPFLSTFNAFLEYIKILRLNILVKFFGFDYILKSRSIAVNNDLSSEFYSNLDKLKLV